MPMRLSLFSSIVVLATLSVYVLQDKPTAHLVLLKQQDATHVWLTQQAGCTKCCGMSSMSPPQPYHYMSLLALGVHSNPGSCYTH